MRLADGKFVFGVTTTGIIAANVPGEAPRRDNVCFFDSPQAANRRGCAPAFAASLLDCPRGRALSNASAGTSKRTRTKRLPLAKLSQAAGISPFPLATGIQERDGHLTPAVPLNRCAFKVQTWAAHPRQLGGTAQ